MRVPICFLFTILCLGQTPEQSIKQAQELYNAGDLHGSARELTSLLSKPEAATYGSIATATAYSNLATVFQDMGRILEAERAYEKARDLLAPHLTDPMTRVLWFRTTTNLASMYMEAQQPGPAERLLKVLETFEMPDGEDRARFKGTTASLLMVRGREREAEKLFIDLLAYWREHNHGKEAAVVLNNLGVISMRRGEWRTATLRLSESLQLWKQTMGENHPAVLTAYANYGYVLLQAGRKQQATELLEKAFADARRLHGDSNPITAHLADLCALALRASGRTKEAKALKAEADRMTAALAPEPRNHVVDVLDFVKK